LTFGTDVVTEIGQLIYLPGVTYYMVAGSQNAWWGWGEIRIEDGVAAAVAHDLEPWLQEHFDTAAWLTYRRR
jgi:hypothetical protein